MTTKTTRYGIEFLAPAVVEGREYQQFSMATPDRSVLKTATGRRRTFKSRLNAFDWAVECFGQGYRNVVRIFEI